MISTVSSSLLVLSVVLGVAQVTSGYCDVIDASRCFTTYSRDISDVNTTDQACPIIAKFENCMESSCPNGTIHDTMLDSSTPNKNRFHCDDARNLAYSPLLLMATILAVFLAVTYG